MCVYIKYFRIQILNMSGMKLFVPEIDLLLVISCIYFYFVSLFPCYPYYFINEFFLFWYRPFNHTYFLFFFNSTLVICQFCHVGCAPRTFYY